jgi:hypothetical protein
MLKFTTLQDMEASLTDYRNDIDAPMSISQAYDSQEGLHTQPLQDILMNNWAKDHLNDRFSRARNNCADFATNVMKATYLNPTTNPVGPTVPKWTHVGPDDDPGVLILADTDKRS